MDTRFRATYSALHEHNTLTKGKTELSGRSKIHTAWNKKRLEQEKETHYATQRFTQRTEDSFPHRTTLAAPSGIRRNCGRPACDRRPEPPSHGRSGGR